MNEVNSSSKNNTKKNNFIWQDPLLLDDLLTEDERIVRDTANSYAQENLMPRILEANRQEKFDRNIMNEMGKLGFLGSTLPEKYGCADVNNVCYGLLAREIERVDSGYRSALSVQSSLVMWPIYTYGNEEQKQRYLPGCVSGEIITAIAMTEPGTGSDLQGVKTNAILSEDGSHYVLNGSKKVITNGQMADLVIVVAKTDPEAGAKGTSLLLVETNSEGFVKGQILYNIGMKAQDTSELFFQDVKVPKANLLGEEGMGFIYLMQELPQERLSVSLAAVSCAESILAQTVEYVKDRKAFGKTIASFQNTQFKLAEMSSTVTMARVFIDKCLELHLDKELDSVTAAKLKLLTTDIQCDVVDECLQLHGGYGYMWEYPVARAYADARVQKIYAGTNEIMKLIIGRDLIK